MNYGNADAGGIVRGEGTKKASSALQWFMSDKNTVKCINLASKLDKQALSI